MPTASVALNKRETYLLLGLYGVPCRGTDVQFEVSCCGLLRPATSPGTDPGWRRIDPDAAAYHLRGSGEAEQIQAATSTPEQQAGLQRALLATPHLGPLLTRCLAAPPLVRSPRKLPKLHVRALRSFYPRGHSNVVLTAQAGQPAPCQRWNWRMRLHTGAEPLPLDLQAVEPLLTDESLAPGDLRSPLTGERLETWPEFGTPESDEVLLAYLLRGPLRHLERSLTLRSALKTFAQPTHLTIWVGNL